MSKQSGQFPNERQEPQRVGKKPKRDRPWLLHVRSANPRKSGHGRWWTYSKYETKELAEVVAAKLAREHVIPGRVFWETRVIHRDQLD